ncbi:protein RGF1 INDUCIBLE TRANSCRIPTION FACTOR 1-like [Beta vulgaris subsp. vulgaris]|uniref:protein RGF1 INDUCIBLE TRANSCRIPTION FACTOR 1-like n=1 Tax=Beta vulgaris subsp. vulgaris TaxID=3555 RepID=UPI0005402123|nr:protein RGF1 INDUCIBLE TRANSCRIPTION FACTOR 1-like [Beta vulgaris subsp. vulgaris]
MVDIQPPWLNSMIHANFSTTQNRKVSEKAYFCVDCGGKTLSKTEIETEHEGHKIFRAMKNSHHYCYTKDDILSLGSEVLDIYGVCVYTINSTSVYFPKSVSNKYHNMKGTLGCCFSCGKPIKWSALFCSILCKLVCNEDNAKLETMKLMMEQQSLEGLSLKKRTNNNKKRKMVEEKNNVGVTSKIKHGVMVILEKKTEQLVKGEGKKIVNEAKLKNLIDVVKGKIVEQNKRKRPRKGIPRRAPLF